MYDIDYLDLEHMMYRVGIEANCWLAGYWIVERPSVDPKRSTFPVLLSIFRDQAVLAISIRQSISLIGFITWDIWDEIDSIQSRVFMNQS